MTLVKAILGALVISAPLFAGTQCTNAAGTLHYEAYRYEGGAAPPNGMLVGKQTWTYKGQVLAQAEQFSNGPFSQLELTADFDPNKRIAVENRSGRAMTDVTWAEKLTLTRTNGAAVLPGNAAKSVTDNFICHDVQRFLP